MPRVSQSIFIDAPPEEVWAVVMDPDRLGDWVTIHRSVDDVSDDPLEEGATMDQTLCLARTKFHVKWKVTEADRPRRVVWQGRGPMRSQARTSYRLTPEGGGTRFDYDNDFRAPGGPFGAVAGQVLVGGISERETQRTLAKLKGLFEGQ